MTQTGSTSAQNVPLLDVSRENGPLSENIKQTICEIVDSGRFIGGPHCQQFEQSVADLCDTEFAIGCASGSDALLLALMALGIKAGDEVICPSFTFFATASCITRLGATPVFVDIDPETFNLDPALIESAITPRTRALIPVHLFGQCCDMEAIQTIASEHNIAIVEDCAQSIGASRNGRMCGSIGDLGCFSFYPTKNLGGMGDGGVVTTNDPELADQVRLLANHGMRPRYYHQEIGINSRLDSIQAAVLGIKVNELAGWTEQRSNNATRYQKLFAARGLGNLMTLPTNAEGSGHVWNQFTVRINDGRRDEVRQGLADRNIGSEIYYPIPLHRQECFQYLGYGPKSLPQTDKAAGEVLSIPVFPGLTTKEQDYVVESVCEVVLGESTQLRVAS